MRILNTLWRLFDVCIAFAAWLMCMLLALVLRFRGSAARKSSNTILLTISKDSIRKVLSCNSIDYIRADFVRHHASRVIILHIGEEPTKVYRLSRTLIGIDIQLPKSAFTSHILPYTSGVVNDFIGLCVTSRFIDKVSAKVLEVMFPSRLVVRAMLIKWLSGIKLVAQVRGNLDLILYFNPFPAFFPFQMNCKPGRLFLVMWDKLISYLFYSCCDLVIGYNTNNMLSAISNGSHPSRTRLSRIKIDRVMLDQKIEPRQDLDCFPETGRVVSLWSRLSPEKMVFETLLAVELLLDRYTDLSMVVIGDGPEFSTIETYIKTRNITDRIYLAGYRNRSYIASAATYSDVVLVPYGGSSLVEAALLEKPIVAFDIEWHNEMIRHGETGLLADFPDPEDMSENISFMLENPAKGAMMAKSCKQLAELMFDEQAVNKRESKIMAHLFTC